MKKLEKYFGRTLHQLFLHNLTTGDQEDLGPGRITGIVPGEDGYTILYRLSECEYGPKTEIELGKATVKEVHEHREPDGIYHYSNGDIPIYDLSLIVILSNTSEEHNASEEQEIKALRQKTKALEENPLAVFLTGLNEIVKNRPASEYAQAKADALRIARKDNKNIVDIGARTCLGCGDMVHYFLIAETYGTACIDKEEQ